MLAFLKRLRERLARKKQAPKPVPARASQALRQLNSGYYRQKRLWLYIILSSMALLCLFLVIWLFLEDITFWGVLIPLSGILISVFQLYRCNELIRTIRQAQIIQLRIEKAQEEAEQKQQGSDAAQGNGKKGGDANGSHRATPPDSV